LEGELAPTDDSRNNRWPYLYRSQEDARQGLKRLKLGSRWAPKEVDGLQIEAALGTCDHVEYGALRKRRSGSFAQMWLRSPDNAGRQLLDELLSLQPAEQEHLQGLLEQVLRLAGGRSKYDRPEREEGIDAAAAPLGDTQ
jgi:hypothetical protein